MTGNTSNTRPGRRLPTAAFTLVELGVVLGVVSLLTALLIPAFSRAREVGRASVCRSNLRQLALSLQTYAPDYHETLPWPGGLNRNLEPDWVWGGQSWEQIALAAAWKGTNFGFHPESGSLYPYVYGQPRQDFDRRSKVQRPAYRCPSTGKLGTALRVNYSMNGWFDPGMKGVEPQGVRISRIGRPSTKVAFVNEDPRVMRNPSFHPGEANALGLFVIHNGRTPFSFLDGHVENLQDRQTRAAQLSPLADSLFSSYH